MPQYEFICQSCGDCFDLRAGYEDQFWPCACGGIAKRKSIYRQSFITAGATLPTDPVAVQQEFFKEVRKAGWDGDRSIAALRHNIEEDKQGRKFLNTKKLPKST